jgi:hypothetical protein
MGNINSTVWSLRVKGNRAVVEVIGRQNFQNLYIRLKQKKTGTFF